MVISGQFRNQWVTLLFTQFSANTDLPLGAVNIFNLFKNIFSTAGGIGNSPSFVIIALLTIVSFFR
jgi:hypothetical protein